MVPSGMFVRYESEVKRVKELEGEETLLVMASIYVAFIPSYR